MSLTKHEDLHETSHTSSVLVTKHLLEPHMCCSPTHSPMHVHQHDNTIKTTNCALLTKYIYRVKECVYMVIFSRVLLMLNRSLKKVISILGNIMTASWDLWQRIVLQSKSIKT